MFCLKGKSERKYELTTADAITHVYSKTVGSSKNWHVQIFEKKIDTELVQIESAKDIHKSLI